MITIRINNKYKKVIENSYYDIVLVNKYDIKIGDVINIQLVNPTKNHNKDYIYQKVVVKDIKIIDLRKIYFGDGWTTAIELLEYYEVSGLTLKTITVEDIL